MARFKEITRDSLAGIELGRALHQRIAAWKNELAAEGLNERRSDILRGRIMAASELLRDMEPAPEPVIQQRSSDSINY